MQLFSRVNIICLTIDCRAVNAIKYFVTGVLLKLQVYCHKTMLFMRDHSPGEPQQIRNYTTLDSPKITLKPLSLLVSTLVKGLFCFSS